MHFWLVNIRKVVYGSAGLWALLLFILVRSSIPLGQLQYIKLTEYYALTALVFLYTALLASPLYHVFPKLPGKPVYIKARQALGITAFFFGLVHGCIAFFGLLGGFTGLGFLTEKYIDAIILSSSALLLLGVMALTSFSYFVKKLGKWWKRLHRVVYVAGVLILIHAFMLGSHFTDISRIIPQVLIFALFILLTLEAFRIDTYSTKQWPRIPRYAIAGVLIGIMAITYFYLPTESGVGIHTEHLQQIREQQKLKEKGAFTSHTVRMDTQDRVAPGEEVELRFSVFDTQGTRVTQFKIEQEKLMHVIIVNNGLTYFHHAHPEFTGSEFVVKTIFPMEDVYHIYTSFLPEGGREQVARTTLGVGSTAMPPINVPDTELTKTIGAQRVTLSVNGPLTAQAISEGKTTFTFSMADAATGRPLTTLEPYLGAFGHLVMIRTESFEYAHVHPLSTPATSQARGGPDVSFAPLALGNFEPFISGTYRLFGQFQYQGELFVADFTIRVD